MATNTIERTETNKIMKPTIKPENTTLIVYDKPSQCWRESNVGTHRGIFDETRGWIPYFDIKST